MRVQDLIPLSLTIGSVLSQSSTRPFTAPIVTPTPEPTFGPLGATNCSSGTRVPIPANTNGPRAPRNVGYIAYAYNNQWKGTNTSQPPINVTSLYADNTGVGALVISPCDLNSKKPGIPQCQGWDFVNSTYWSQIWPMYQQVQRNGILLFASYGGFGSTTFELLNQNWTLYYPPIVYMLRKYKFDGVDFDIEPSNNNYFVPDLSLALKLVNSIRMDMGQDFLITLSPISSDLLKTQSSNFSGFNSWQLDQDSVTTGTDGQPMKNINWFNAQFYSGGMDISTSAYETVIANGDWDPSRIVALAATSNIASGWVNITKLESIAQQLTNKYGKGKLGGVGGYEYARAGQSDDLSNWRWFRDLSETLGTVAWSGRK